MFVKTQTADPQTGQFYHQYQTKKQSDKTLYFIGPYTGRKIYFLPFFYTMYWFGYRIVYLQPVNDVLNAMQPTWLEQAILQAGDIIYQDRSEVSRKSDYLIGVSLGSYIGLNLLLSEQFKKFVVIAGGAPLIDVFRSHYLFGGQRRRLRKTGGFSHVNAHWEKFDKAYKKYQLKDLEILGFNSKADRMITQDRLQPFMQNLTDAGAKVESRLNYLLPHEVQAFSTNWRMWTIHSFFNHIDQWQRE